MNWEDERYVKLYTRESPEYESMSFQARGLHSLLMKKVDRAGKLPLGRLGGAKGVAQAVRADWVAIEPYLKELLDDGCVTIGPAADPDKYDLFLPNFLEAQEARQSESARQRKAREVARAMSGGASSDASEKLRNVTNRDGIQSQNVTESSGLVTSGHAPSRLVTSRHDLEETRTDKRESAPRTHAREAVLIGAAEDIRKAIESHPELALVHSDSVRLAERAESHRMTSGKKLDWVLGAIRRAAEVTGDEGGAPLPEMIRKRIGTFIRNASEKDVAAPAAPPRAPARFHVVERDPDAGPMPADFIAKLNASTAVRRSRPS